MDNDTRNYAPSPNTSCMSLLTKTSFVGWRFLLSEWRFTALKYGV